MYYNLSIRLFLGDHEKEIWKDELRKESGVVNYEKLIIRLVIYDIPVDSGRRLLL